MSTPEEHLLFENEAYRLSSIRLTQPGLEAVVERPDLLVITRNGERREVAIPPQMPGEPSYRGSLPVLMAMYALAAHELRQDTTPDGLLLAGANWSTVWTRDIAYAAALGAALLEPEACRRSLESRVRNGVIMQDTGTGGGWPVSTDRVIWALGAWSLDTRLGDPEWLDWAADVLMRTLEQDELFMSDETPLHRGETSFLDWREQSYPDWMTPANIGETYAFGTNVVHYIARSVLARMLSELGRKKEAAAYRSEATRLREAINEAFWSRASRSYGMFRTADGFLDEHTDALATALAVMSGMAGEHATQALAQLPRSPWGTPVFSPYKSGGRGAYHNRAVWPFVEAYVLLAHAEMSNTEGCAFSLASLLRAAMAFGTNKENLHAQTGEAGDTLLNSDRQLWSVTGMLGAFYYGLFGLRREGNSITFAPCVPRQFRGSHWLTNLRIRNMVLDIHLKGFGNSVCQVSINGKMGTPILPLDASGHYLLEFELLPSEDEQDDALPHPAAKDDLPEPQWDEPTSSLLRWKPVPGASRYSIFRNGTAFACTGENTCSYPIRLASHYDVYRVRAENAEQSSALSKPFCCVAPGARQIILPYRIGEEAEYRIEKDQAWLDTRPCTSRLDYEDVTLASGTYMLRVYYCNATESMRDGDTCAIRQLYIDGRPDALIALPHNTECGNWEDYGYSAAVTVSVKSGRHRFSLRYNERCLNANGDVNQCMVRQIELTRLH